MLGRVYTGSTLIRILLNFNQESELATQVTQNIVSHLIHYFEIKVIHRLNLIYSDRIR